jgi:hypothetical protein
MGVMAKRKPRKPHQPSGGPERHALAMLERAVVERLTTRARKAVARGQDLDIDEWAERELEPGEERSDEEKGEIMMFAIAQQFEYRIENGSLLGYVRSFMRRNPLYLNGSSLDIAKAVWQHATWCAVKDAVDHLIDETDANGEPRFLRGRDDPNLLYPNPGFEGD